MARTLELRRRPWKGNLGLHFEDEDYGEEEENEEEGKVVEGRRGRRGEGEEDVEGKGRGAE